MINKNMTTQEILERFYHERNSSPGTQRIYNQSIKTYEKWSNSTLTELMNIAEKEETENIHWRNSTLKRTLLDYRRYLYDTYKIRTADSYLTNLISVLRHYDITVPRLPYFSLKNANKPDQVYPEDLPDQETLKKTLLINNPLLKAITLLMSSSGISRADTLNLTVNDYLEATSDYHNDDDNVLRNIIDLNNNPVDVIPTWHLRRQKTGQEYFTFSSPESTVAINSYLWSREDKLTRDSRLFKVHERYFNILFQRTNDMLKLGKVNNASRFSPHSLRRYHATRLAEAGVSTDFINILQGRRNNNVAHESYIRVKPDVLREKYIGALPFLVVEDVSRVKSELDVVKLELEERSRENVVLKENLRNIINRIEKLENQ